MSAALVDCDSCGSAHMRPVPCGMTYRERLMSVTTDGAWQPNRSRRNYYDADGAAESFDPEAAENVARDIYDRGVVTRSSAGITIDRPGGGERPDMAFTSGPEVGTHG